MENLAETLNRLCPDGVEFLNLGECFDLFSGMTGVSNKWAEDGNCLFIDYLNVYNNMRVDVSKLMNATVQSFKQNTLQVGDILLTSASETPEECAMSSVIRDDIADNIFLDDHLFGIRLKEEYKDQINVAFLNYYFHTSEFRTKVCRVVRGVTRFYIVNKSFLKLSIPVPPIEVQNEIVKILDNFTELAAELQAELQARKLQYEYYRNKLLSFNELNRRGASNG